MKIPRILLLCHLLALAFGLGGLIIIMRNPSLWVGNPAAQRVYAFGMQHGGVLHIILGAATMFAFGLAAIGWRKTVVFFLVGTLLPLCAEEIGTATGWPFGGYSYTDGLGYKLLGRVPYSVPLSWFYMGFTSYLLANIILSRWGGRNTWATLLLGAWLLMAWDLVLDPAMASAAMPTQFWTWHESGPYFGMPIRNLVGWFATGLVFMGVSRFFWRGEVDGTRLPTFIPFVLYAANVLWAMTLALSVGMWPAAAAAVLCSLVPAALVWRRAGELTGRRPVLAGVDE